jgi:uncharacterized membrane protein
MELEPLLRWLHVIGAAVLLGTGAGIAFFMVMARRTKDPRVIAAVADIVVIADTIFTATAVIVQPVTGYFMARVIGWPLTEVWLMMSMALYVLTGLLWLPVVWIQLQLRRLARVAATDAIPLSAEFDRLYSIWFVAGIPAFTAVLAIYWLMLNKPAIGLP